MAKLPFTESDVERWRAAMLAQAPSIADLRADELPQIEGIAVHAEPSVLVVCLRAADGRDITFALNPAAARLLAIASLGEGQRVGWITSGSCALAIPGTSIEP